MSPRNAKPQPWTEEKHPASTSALLTALRHLRDKNPKAVRANVHIYPSSIFLNNGESSEIGKQRDRRITSWKMTEHMYFNASNPFPTLARGLLTEEVEDGDELPPGLGEDEPVADRIVARGYDKFFNVDEVEWTNVSLHTLHCRGTTES
jgi:tRNA ligase